MSDEERNAGEGGTATAAASVPSEQPYFDEHTTEPNAPSVEALPKPPAPGNWQMPKPKFQQTSGKLPQGYAKALEATAKPAIEGGSASPDPPKSEASAPPAVEPQPELNEFVPDDPAPDPAAQPPSPRKASSLPLVIAALIGAAVILAIFLVTVYFLFLANPSSGTNF